MSLLEYIYDIPKGLWYFPRTPWVSNDIKKHLCDRAHLRRVLQQNFSTWRWVGVEADNGWRSRVTLELLYFGAKVFPPRFVTANHDCFVQITSIVQILIMICSDPDHDLFRAWLWFDQTCLILECCRGLGSCLRVSQPRMLFLNWILLGAIVQIVDHPKSIT